MNDILQQAIAAQQAGDLDHAERLYQTVLQAQPDHADTLALLGTVHDAKGRHAEAISLIEKALAQDSGSGLFHFYMGNALLNAGKAAQAVASFRHAIVSTPDMAQAYYGLGNALLADNQRSEAIAAYRNAVRITPHFSPARKNLALALAQENALAEAIEQMKSGLALTPAYNEGWIALGMLAGLAKDHGLALIAWKKNVELDPDHYTGWASYAEELFVFNHLELAAQAYRRALALRPDSDQTRERLRLVDEALDREARLMGWHHKNRDRPLPILLFYGNCQALAMWQLLSSIASIAALFDLRYIANFDVTHDSKPLTAEDWSRVAVVFEQYTEHAPLTYGLAPENMSRVLFPAGDCLFLWPLNAADPLNKPIMPDMPYGPYSYGDRAVIEMRKQPLPHDPYGEYQKLARTLMPNLDRLYDLDKMRYERREQNTDVKMSSYLFASNRHDSAFWTYNHPKGEFLREILRQLIALARFPDSIDNAVLWEVIEPYSHEWDPLGTWQAPIDPVVAAHFKLPVGEDTLYVFKGKQVTHREWVIDYLNYDFEKMCDGTPVKTQSPQ